MNKQFEIINTLCQSLADKYNGEHTLTDGDSNESSLILTTDISNYIVHNYECCEETTCKSVPRDSYDECKREYYLQDIISKLNIIIDKEINGRQLAKCTIKTDLNLVSGRLFVGMKTYTNEYHKRCPKCTTFLEIKANNDFSAFDDMLVSHTLDTMFKKGPASIDAVLSNFTNIFEDKENKLEICCSSIKGLAGNGSMGIFLKGKNTIVSGDNIVTSINSFGERTGHTHFLELITDLDKYEEVANMRAFEHRWTEHHVTNIKIDSFWIDMKKAIERYGKNNVEDLVSLIKDLGIEIVEITKHYTFTF